MLALAWLELAWLGLPHFAYDSDLAITPEAMIPAAMTPEPAPPEPVNPEPVNPEPVNPDRLTAIDQELSKRFIELDPAGYFVIYLDRDTKLICADHYTNAINDAGLATDPETGEVLACQGSLKRQPTQTYRGHTAKEIGMIIVEQTQPCPLTRLDHALYLGREFVRAELALLNGEEYIQD
jgi:dihydropteroate synthase